MNDEHRVVRESLASYVVGQLPEAERSVVAAHLESCAECRAELETLNDTIAFVRSASIPAGIDFAAPPIEPPADLGERVVANLRGDASAPPRRSQRRTFSGIHRRPAGRFLLAAAAAIALLAAGVGVGLRLAQPAAPPYEPIAFNAPPAGVQASGKLIAHTWGTEANLVISGLEAGHRYRVTFVAADGRQVPGGTFIGVSGRPIVCNVNAAVLREQAVLLRITDEGELPVLEANLTI